MTPISTHVQSQDLVQSLAGRSTADLLQYFDTLDPVDLDFMIGRWRGIEIKADPHPLDGFLSASNWYGKEFVDPEHVHPLLFLDGQNQLFKVAPSPLSMKLGLGLPILKSKAFQPLLRAMTWVSKTEVSQARLRMTEYRNQVSATMIYDLLPINDVFRQLDDHTVLGVMDFKWVEPLYFFVLQRDEAQV